MTTQLACLDDYEQAARALVEEKVWEYVESGAADEHTLRWNREAFARRIIYPRMLRDVSSVDTSCELLGARLESPILLAPVAAHGMVHPEGEVASAQGAKSAGAGMVLSSYTSRPVEEVAATGISPLWFQLYMQERAATQLLIHRVIDAGASAICITVDTPVSGARNRQERSGFDWPIKLPYRTVEPGQNPCTWDDVAKVRSAVSVPLFLKGILHPADAELAISAGVDGIIVSNHGGRNLDTAPATLDVLPEIAARVDGRVPLLIDGGIRRGTDIVKAIALGASAVLIGRPSVYGLAVDGANGVAAVINILRRELELAMKLAGLPRLADIDGRILSLE
jgi:4-hydroxymandelate oxidase